MIRMPHVSANVLLRRMGGYEHPTNLDDAGLIHMYGMFCRRGLLPREAARVGRQDLSKASYDHLERNIRDLLARTLKDGGFDPASDIEAITVNRWAHGCSIEYVSPWDNASYPDGPLPGEAASTPFGRITFAGIDRSSRAYMDAAIDAASSAVNELMDRLLGHWARTTARVRREGGAGGVRASGARTRPRAVTHRRPRRARAHPHRCWPPPLTPLIGS